MTTHDAVGSNLPRARPTRIHQREIDRRNSKQRDHRWFLRVALHAVMVRSVSQDRPRHDLSVYDFGIWARRLMRSNRPPSWPLELLLRALKFANIRHGAQGMIRSAVGKLASVVAIAALALIVMPQAAQSQGFPSKPVRVIVPYTPGSPNDVLARLLAQPLQGKLGQPVVIDERTDSSSSMS